MDNPRRLKTVTVLALLALSTLAAQPYAHAEQQVDAATNGLAQAVSTSAIGGPASVGAQLNQDNQVHAPAVRMKALDRAEAWLLEERRALRNWAGLTLGADYDSLVQGATESLGEDEAAGGVFRIYGKWSCPGEPRENPGSLTFKVENRRRYTDIAPQQLGAQIGYTALTADTWSNAGWLLSNFYWYQQLLDNRLAFAVGVMDTTDYVDVYGLVNPWTDFMNSVFLTNPTIATPGQGLGLAMRGSITPNLYVLGGFANANGDPTEPLQDFDTFFTAGEFFKHLEFGWISSWEKREQDNIHLTLWQTSARSEAGVPSGWGAAFSAGHLFAERWLPFVRAGWSDGGGGVPLEAAAAVGVGYYLREKSDLLALGLNWGRPSSETYGNGLRDEYTVETLYRVHLLKRLSLTPDIQLIIHPARNPGTDAIAVFGLRARLAF